MYFKKNIFTTFYTYLQSYSFGYEDKEVYLDTYNLQ